MVGMFSEWLYAAVLLAESAPLDPDQRRVPVRV